MSQQDTKDSLRNSREQFIAQNSDNQQQNVDDVEKTLDNVEKNSYISDSSNADGNGGKDLNKVLLEQTFGGDVNKLAESYREQSSQVTKIIQEKKRLEQEAQRLALIKERAAQDAKLQAILDKLEKGEDYRSLLDGDEPDSGKHQQSSVNKPTNQLTEVDERTLAKEGLLDMSLKNIVSDYEWNRMKTDAMAQYMPKIIAERSFQEFQNKLVELEKQREQENLQKEADSRFKQSLDNFIANHKVNFAGEHADLLDEIYLYANAYRDPLDRRLPRKDAVELAAREVFASKGIKLEPALSAQVNTKNQLDGGFNSSTKTEKQGKPKSLAEIRREKLQSKYNTQINLYGSFRNRQ